MGGFHPWDDHEMKAWHICLDMLHVDGLILPMILEINLHV